MSGVLKWTAIVILVLAGAVVAVGYLLVPSEYSVVRSVTIQAQPEQIHRLVGDLEMWPEWTPWQEADPTIQVVLGRTTRGVGARQSWSGQSGDGELTFTRSDPRTGVAYDMAFDGGRYRSIGEIEYRDDGTATRVVWSMRGDSGMNLIGRYFGLLIDSMVGPSFETGLDRLKIKAETLPPLRPGEIETTAAEG